MLPLSDGWILSIGLTKKEVIFPTLNCILEKKQLVQNLTG